jgi:4-hydroxyphenylpyruvate dioxygenase
MTTLSLNREAIEDAPNPLGLEGLEFVEYETAKPQALGQLLEAMGFRPVARHRSREIMLYRQGEMNIVVNSHHAVADAPVLSAFALRVKDAGSAFQRSIDRGAWPVVQDVKPMELNIPAIHGVGGSRIYFIDRWREFSIWDVDFVPIPGAEQRPPALAGMHWFGLVQYIGLWRVDDWTEFYLELFGWRALPDDERFGVMPSGRLLQSPDGLMLQLIEPEPDASDIDGDESIQRLGFGVPDVLSAVAALKARGVEFVEGEKTHTETRGAVTRTQMGSVMFELVHRAP